MSLNLTACWLNSRLSTTMVHFSAAVGTTSIYLKGAGGQAGDGFPLPKGGVIKSMTIWAGGTSHKAEGKIFFDSGDRVAIAGVPNGGSFDWGLLLNGIAMQMSLQGLPPNTSYFATVEVLLKEDA